MSRAKAKNKKRAVAQTSELPARDDIVAFVQSAGANVGKREIARHFRLHASQRTALKRLLNELIEDGTLVGNRKGFRPRGGLPRVAVLEVVGSDADGDLVLEPLQWNPDEGPKPKAVLHTDFRDKRSIEIGHRDRVLTELTPLTASEREAAGQGVTHRATPIRRLPRDQRQLLGIYRKGANRKGGSIEPIDRKMLKSWSVRGEDASDAKDGDLVRFELLRRDRNTLSQARIVSSLGNPDDQRQISLIAVHAHGLPDTFPETVLKELDTLKPPTMQGRTDLRNTPLITIDPADARDHDDAVFARPDADKKNQGGYIVIVAIADVAHYVRPATRLDREALKRANSVYFPDRVVPMLPERISNDLCSLRENEERPCLAVEMTFKADGTKLRHTFMRAMMRSHAKLSYQQAQAAFDGNPAREHQPLMKDVLEPLWQAYRAVKKARDERGPLELDLPERKIVLNDQGKVADVVVPERLEAHRLIEEFMIQANVAAAESLEKNRLRLIYRVHEAPSKEKLKSLSEFLETLDLKGPKAGDVKPQHFNVILKQAAKLPSPELVHEMILRSQAQAVYAPDNAGHFGLNLRRYAHFTSPIRRYADLIVHRALIRALSLGEGGVTDEEIDNLADIAQSISEAERRAMAAERETVDRLIAAHLADRIGVTFQARVAGVTAVGLFVRLSETGADGFVPISTLDDDYYEFDEAAMALVGRRSSTGFRLGDTVEVRLVEAIPTAGALRFEMLSPGTKMRRPPHKASRQSGKRFTRPPRRRRR